MPRFLEDKLKREYPNNPGAVYGTMNAIGAMHGSKETAKGREMERKHEADMKKGMATPEPMREMRIEIHRGPKNKVTGFTVHHHMVPKPASKSGAFMENTEHSQPFSTAEHGKMMDHIDEHTSAQMGGAKAAPATEEQEPDGEEED